MSNLPLWLVQGRENILKTQEWNNISDTFDNIENFTGLSDTEKCLVLERAARCLKATISGEPTPYGDLNERVSDLLRKGVYTDDSEPFFTYDPETKTDLILNKISDGIVSLLCDWPDRKYKLHGFFNHSLPQPIRFVSWYLHLSNTNHRQKFLEDLSNHPQSVLSPMDSEIQRHCDSLIKTLPVASTMINSKKNLSTMKAILSYHRSLFPNKHDLADFEYYYAIPIVLSHNPPLSRSEESCEKSLSILIEMYRSFLDRMPQILRNVYLNNSRHELEPWFYKVEFHLKRLDQSVYNHLQTILHSSNLYLSTADNSQVLILIRKYCYTWFKYLFVGCLTSDPLLFVWDQYLITSDVSNCYDELLPAIGTSIIIALRELLLECRQTSEIELILQHKTNIIMTKQLQLVIARLSLSDFKNKTDKQSTIPVIQWANVDPQIGNRSQVKLNLIHDLLRKIAETCNRVIHGEGDNRAIFDEQTRNNIRILKFDLKMSEREVIGRILPTDEWNELPDKQKEIYSKQQLKAVNLRIQNRYIIQRKK